MSITIVVIDDNPDDIYTIKRLLKNDPGMYNVLSFENSFEAMSYLCSHQVDCILIDYNLTDMTGIEFAEVYQRNYSLSAPMIILTGQGNEEIAVDVIKKGISDYIVKKNLNYGILTKSIQYAIEKKKNEIKENEYKEFFKILINTIPEPVFFKDTLGRFIGCNKAFEDFLGHSINEIIGKTVHDFLPKKIANLFTEKDKELFNNPGVQIYESKTQKADGEERYVINKKATYNNIKGEVAGLIGIINDITEMKRNELILAEKSYIDSLTGINNRRFFDERIEIEWKNSNRNSQPISLIMIDIDHFKLYNDNYGHQKGDDCLKKIARTLETDLKRPADWIARYGGEEFIIVLPATDTEGAVHVAAELQHSVKKLSIPHNESPVDSIVTISLGVSSCNCMQGSIANCIKSADEALYKAKSLGRNRIETV